MLLYDFLIRQRNLINEIWTIPTVKGILYFSFKEKYARLIAVKEHKKAAGLGIKNTLKQLQMLQKRHKNDSFLSN